MTETPPHLAKLFSLAEARRKKQEKREAIRGADDSWYDTIMLWIELIPVKYRDQLSPLPNPHAGRSQFFDSTNNLSRRKPPI